MNFIVLLLFVVPALAAVDYRNLLIIKAPPFLQNMPPQAANDFNQIVNNPSSTRAQQDQSLDQWAAQYGVQSEWNLYRSEQQFMNQQIQQKVWNSYNYNAQDCMELLNIINNPNLTTSQKEAQINSLRNDNTRLIDAMLAALQAPYSNR